MSAIGATAILDGTQPCPAATVCNRQPKCLLGDGDSVPTVTTDNMRIVCTEFETAHEAAIKEAGE